MPVPAGKKPRKFQVEVCLIISVYFECGALNLKYPNR
jgi:hypothetical protein